MGEGRWPQRGVGFPEQRPCEVGHFQMVVEDRLLPTKVQQQGGMWELNDSGWRENLVLSALIVIPTMFLTWESTICGKKSSKCIEDAEGLSLAKWGFILPLGTLAQALAYHTVLQGVSTERNPFRRTPPPSALCCPNFLAKRCLRQTLNSNQSPKAERLAPNQPSRPSEMSLGEISAPWRHLELFVVQRLEVHLM